MRKKEISNEYKAISNLLESLYLDSKYEDVINIRYKYQDSFLFDESTEEYPQIIEKLLAATLN